MQQKILLYNSAFRTILLFSSVNTNVCPTSIFICFLTSSGIVTWYLTVTLLAPNIFAIHKINKIIKNIHSHEYQDYQDISYNRTHLFFYIWQVEMTKSKNYVILILSGILAIFASVNLYNDLIPKHESEDRISDTSQNADYTSNPETEQTSKTELPSDPKIAKLASMMILLTHWKSILDSAEEFGDTSSGFLRSYSPTETITDLYGEKPITIVADAVNMLSILGPHDQDVIDVWEYDVMRNLSRMNSKQIVSLIDIMDEEAKKKNLEGYTLTFFNEQKEKAYEILNQAREKEPSEETKQLVLTNLQKYADDTKRHKENLLRLELIEIHYPIRDKMLQYVNQLETAIDEFTLYVKTGELEHVEESAKQAEAGSRLQYEIDEIIKVESNS